jgi:hypothetical protein
MKKFKRLCNCGKEWYCHLECEEEHRGKQADFCHCRVCFAEDVRTSKWAKADMDRANMLRCPRLKPEGFVFR